MTYPYLRLYPFAPLPLLYVTNLQNYHKFEIKIHYIWHQNLQFLQKLTHFLLFFAHKHVPSIHTPEYTLKIPLLHANCTSYLYTNNLSHKLIGILFPIISHYFPSRQKDVVSLHQKTNTQVPCS